MYVYECMTSICKYIMNVDENNNIIVKNDNKTIVFMYICSEFNVVYDDFQEK